MEVFGIKIEFEHDLFRSRIAECRDRKEKGYVCVVDANVITMTRHDEAYRKLVRDSYVNTCDGSSIASMVNKIYGTNYRAFNGPDVFAEYIEKNDFKQLLLGNTVEKFEQIRAKLEVLGKASDHISYMPVPFAKIDEFDYVGIAEQIKAIDPDIIWVSLGAPKQENFMVRLLPHIERGLMFGIGAAFNFYVGDIAQPKFHIGALRFIWLDRIIKEPRKQLKRIRTALLNYPPIYREEKKRKKLLEHS